MVEKFDPSLLPKRPDLQFESLLWENGVHDVAGIDEAGRGAWRAGCGGGCDPASWRRDRLSLERRARFKAVVSGKAKFLGSVYSIRSSGIWRWIGFAP
jgi:hypothetical protein